MTTTATIQAQATDAVLVEIGNEREDQRRRWGNAHDDRHLAPDWIARETRLLGDVAKQATSPEPDRQQERRALVKLTAVCAAHIEALDRDAEVAADVGGCSYCADLVLYGGDEACPKCGMTGPHNI